METNGTATAPAPAPATGAPPAAAPAPLPPEIQAKLARIEALEQSESVLTGFNAKVEALRLKNPKKFEELQRALRGEDLTPEPEAAAEGETEFADPATAKLAAEFRALKDEMGALKALQAHKATQEATADFDRQLASAKTELGEAVFNGHMPAFLALVDKHPHVARIPNAAETILRSLDYKAAQERAVAKFKADAQARDSRFAALQGLPGRSAALGAGGTIERAKTPKEALERAVARVNAENGIS